MNIKEYDKIKNLDYFEYCNYLNSKYKDRSRSGLFKHHYYEYRKANLSNIEVAKHSTEEEKNTIIYCNFLEHLFLHILIGEQTDSRLALGLGGAINYIIPQINKYLDFGVMDYSPKYYENIDKDVFQLLCERCNQCVSKTQIALEHNNQLYLEVEQTLKDKGKALVVLGTGLGKTTTALQYLWNNKCRALVVGPNKLIKSGWEEYSDWADTTTYQSFTNRHLSIDYSKYGLVILDEAHHAGFDEKVGRGAEVWSKGIKYLLDDKVIKVLGLTATPNRSDNVDIGNTLFEDCVCEGYAVEDGIEKGLIYPFDYITALYNTEELIEEYKDCDNRELVGQLDLALQQSLTLKDIFYKYMPTDVKRKGIIFIQDIKDEQYVKDIMSDCYPNIEYRAIHSKMNKEEINRNREWFESVDEGYLLAVNMISEGAHYKGVNTLIMFRKTSSYLVYTQQLGRIITLTKNENPNAIVFDLVNNIDSIEYSNRDNEDKRYQVSRIVRALEKSPLQKSKQVIIADESRDIVKAIREIKYYNSGRWTEEEDAILYSYFPIEGKQCESRFSRDRDSASRAYFLGIKGPGHNEWTEEEDNILKTYFPIEGVRCKERFERYRDVASRARQLNIKYEGFYTEEEDNIIKIYYPLEGNKCFERFPQNRKIFNRDIDYRAKQLGVEKTHKRRQWTEEEDTFLIQNYLKLPLEEIMRLLQRSDQSITTRATQLKIFKPRSIFTSQDDEIIKKYYPLEGKACIKRLPPHLQNCDISSRAHLIGTENPLRGKRVICIETSIIYKSATEAMRSFNIKNIDACCRGEQKVAGGYHWKYVEEGDENKNE